MKELKRKWERMEDSLVCIRRELEEMRRREDDWRVKREGIEKRMGELELKLEKGLKIGDRGEKIGELNERLRVLEKGDRKAEAIKWRRG